MLLMVKGEIGGWRVRSGGVRHINALHVLAALISPFVI